MKSTVRAQSLVSLDKPPLTWAVVEDEISFKKENRSSKPEVGYYIASENKYRTCASKLKGSEKTLSQDPLTPVDVNLSPKAPSAPLLPFTLDETTTIQDTPKSVDGEAVGGLNENVKKQLEKTVVKSPVVVYLPDDLTVATEPIISKDHFTPPATAGVDISEEDLELGISADADANADSDSDVDSDSEVDVNLDLGDLSLSGVIEEEGYENIEEPALSPPPAYVDVDSDSEVMAEERAIAPSQFHGTAAENAENWVRNLEMYCNYKAYNDEKKLALCKVLLVDGAANW